MARAPKKPVSDKSLYLWLSAVLGVWEGFDFLLIQALPLARGFPRNAAWWICGSMTVVLSVLIIASAPRHMSAARRFGLSLTGYLLTLACGMVTSDVSIMLDGSNLYRTVHANLMEFYFFSTFHIGQRLFLLRFIVAWSLVWIGAVIYRLVRKRQPRACRPCASCGFDLVGLSPTTVCPECGHSSRTPIDRESRISRVLRGLCRTVVVCAILGVLSSAVPETVVWWHYRFQGPRPAWYWSGWRMGMVYCYRITFILYGSNGRLGFLQVTLDSEFPAPPDRPRLHSQFFLENPIEHQHTTPLLDADGLIPADAIKAIIDAPASPAPPVP